MLPAKEPQAFQEIKLNEVILSVAICHPRTVGEAVCEMILQQFIALMIFFLL